MSRQMFLVTAVVAVLFLSGAPALAELDLDQEVLIIPDTHNEKPYIWNVRQNPREYDLSFQQADVEAGREHVFRFSITSREGSPPEDLHVFVTDHDLHTYAHLRPVKEDGGYRFTFTPPTPGRYRVEIVFPSAGGWINLREDVRVKEGGKKGADDRQPGDEDYHVSVKPVPKTVYAEHVVTFVYGLEYKGRPLSGIEKTDGFDMQVATWDEDLKEFLYVTPRQNLGGPEVAVSMVFMRPGRHAVFAEFTHNGVKRRVDFVISVRLEPSVHPEAPIYQKPSD